MMVAGFGCRRGATLCSLRDALARALALARPGSALRMLAAPHDKVDIPPLRALAAELGLPLYPITATQAAAMLTLTDSVAVRTRRGTGSTAEATALAAARMFGGPTARLSRPRAVSTDRMATCAIAMLTTLPRTPE